MKTKIKTLPRAEKIEEEIKNYRVLLLLYHGQTERNCVQLREGKSKKTKEEILINTN